MPPRSPSAGQRLYDNDVIAHTLISHLNPATLVSVMCVEQRGDRFDQCVKELYYEVGDHAIKSKNPDDARHRQYLDAVRVINRDLHDPFAPSALPEDQITEAEPILALRLTCPNLQAVRRGDFRSDRVSYEIRFRPSTSTPTIWVHEAQSSIEMGAQGRMVHRSIHTTPAKWRRIDTAFLDLEQTQSSHEQLDVLWAALRNPCDLDTSFTGLRILEIEITLPLLATVVEHRRSGTRPFTVIEAWVKPFSFAELSAFVASSGEELESLKLRTSGSISSIGFTDLPRVVALVRDGCPKLRTFALPWSLSHEGQPVSDSHISPPPSRFADGRGRLKSMVIYLDPMTARRISSVDEAMAYSMSYNFALNMACLIKQGGRISLDIVNERAESATLHLRDQRLIHFTRIFIAIEFFRGLGPTLEPHFRQSSLAQLGLSSLSDLGRLRYKTDGTPLTLKQSLLLTKRTRGKPTLKQDTPVPNVRDISTQTDESSMTAFRRHAASVATKAHKTPAENHDPGRRHKRARQDEPPIEPRRSQRRREAKEQ